MPASAPFCPYQRNTNPLRPRGSGYRCLTTTRAAKQTSGWFRATLLGRILLLIVIAASIAPPTESAVHTTLADPIVRADCLLKADRTVSWNDGQTRMLLLEREVTVQIGAYGFRAHRVVARIDIKRLPGHQSLHQLTLYLDQAQPLQGTGPVSAQAPRLLVTATTSGQLRLSTNLLEKQIEAVNDAFVNQAILRMARHRLALETQPLDVPPGAKLLSQDIQSIREIRRQQIAQESLRKALADQTAKAQSSDPLATTSEVAPRPIMSSSGTLIFHADKMVFQDNQNSNDQSTLALLGNVRVVYQNHNRQQSMSLQAENAVIFIAADAANRVSQRHANAADVSGVYLEDNVVATDGQYTVRAPRVFYDLKKNKAIVLDAVFYAWDVKHDIPIYVRAEKLRQESMTHWSASGATLTTSEFAEPHFSIASGQLMFRRQMTSDGSPGYRFVARDSTLRWGPMPIFYWPYLAGSSASLEDHVLPRVSGSYSDHDGAIVKTTGICSRWPANPSRRVLSCEDGPTTWETAVLRQA